MLRSADLLDAAAKEMSVMQPSKVSVVMLTYGRSTIRQAVESVLSQTVEDLELLIVVDPWRCDDPSGIHLPRDSRLRVLSPQLGPCPGYLPSRLATLRNFGVQTARGDYVAYLDDDNWWAPTHLESLCTLLDSTPHYGFVHSWRIMVDEKGSPVPLHTYPWTTRYANRDEMFRLLVEYGVIVPGSAYFRSAVASEYGDEVLWVDTSELCVRRELNRRIPWRVKYPPRQVAAGQGEDTALVESLYQQKIPYGCSREHSLYYRLGGYSNLDHGRLIT